MGRQIMGYREANNDCRVLALGEKWCLPLNDPARPAGQEMFEWGYGGAGPRDLARAILFAVTADDETSQALCQLFKWEVVAKLDRAFWVLDYADVEEWLIRRISMLQARTDDNGAIELGEVE